MVKNDPRTLTRHLRCTLTSMACVVDIQGNENNFKNFTAEDKGITEIGA